VCALIVATETRMKGDFRRLPTLERERRVQGHWLRPFAPVIIPRWSRETRRPGSGHSSARMLKWAGAVWWPGAYFSSVRRSTFHRVSTSNRFRLRTFNGSGRVISVSERAVGRSCAVAVMPAYKRRSNQRIAIRVDEHGREGLRGAHSTYLASPLVEMPGPIEPRVRTCASARYGRVERVTELECRAGGGHAAARQKLRLVSG